MGFVAFTIEQAKDIWRAVRKIDGMRGDGVENTATAVSIKAVPIGRSIVLFGGGDFFLVKVKNNSGSNCEKFHILGIDSNYYSPTTELESFKSEVAFNGITPTTASHKGKFLICAEAITSGSIGRAWIAGCCQVQIDVTNASHTTADVKNSDRTMLSSGYDGNARILYKESGTGTKWAIIARFGYGTSACS